MRISFALSLFLILAACRAADEPSAKSESMAAEVCLAGNPTINVALECLRQRGFSPGPDAQLPRHWTYAECASQAKGQEPARCTRVVIATDVWERVTEWRVAEPTGGA